MLPLASRTFPSRRAWISLAALAVVLGCSSDGASGPVDCQQVELTVGPGVRPIYSWTSQCLGVALFVTDMTTGESVWGVTTGGNTYKNTLRPALTHGLKPAGTDEVFPPVALVRGRTYEVILFRQDGQFSVIAGQALFTP